METQQGKIKVLFDYQTFHIQRFGGISRYFYELIKRMHGCTVTTALRVSMNRYIENDKVVPHCHTSLRFFKIMEGVFRKMNRNFSTKEIEKGEFDIFHPTYYDPYFLDVIGHKPFVLTIHDMTHEMYPQYFAAHDFTAHKKRLLADKATRIIAISEYTKAKIMEFLNVEEDKIDVVYHGITPRNITTKRAKGLPQDYVLYVGERRGYKNFDRTIDAFCLLLKKFPELKLVLTGRKLSVSEQQQFANKGIADKVLVYSDITDDTLDMLYHHARVFVYPSLCEGFGIPILEAFAQECPVVLSNASCFPEIGGNACDYFEAENTAEMAEVMERILCNEAHRQELIARGKERLKLFTWDETARKTEECYRKAIGL